MTSNIYKNSSTLSIYKTPVSKNRSTNSKSISDIYPCVSIPPLSSMNIKKHQREEEEEAQLEDSFIIIKKPKMTMEEYVNMDHPTTLISPTLIEKWNPLDTDEYQKIKCLCGDPLKYVNCITEKAPHGFYKCINISSYCENGEWCNVGGCKIFIRGGEMKDYKAEPMTKILCWCSEESRRPLRYFKTSTTKCPDGIWKCRNISKNEDGSYTSGCKAFMINGQDTKTCDHNAILGITRNGTEYCRVIGQKCMK